MTHGRVFWAASLLVASLAASAPAAAEVLTLAEVERRAQRDRPELVERQASIARANAELEGMRAKRRPTVIARGDLALAPGGELVPITDTNGQRVLVQGAPALGDPGAGVPRARYAAMLSGKLTLLDFGRTSLGVRAAEAAMNAERASLLEAKVELVRNAREAYLAWVEAHQTWQLAQKDAELTSTRSASVRALITEGVRPATDATLSAYDEQLAKLRETRARRASAIALEALAATVTGELPPAPEPDLSVLEAPALPASAKPVEAEGAEAALRALDLQRDAANTAARAADRAHAPTLDAAAELGVQGQDSELFPAYRAAVSLTVPLYDGGMQSALAEQRRAEARGFEARRQLIAHKLRAQQAAAQRALQAAGEELGLTLELLRTAETLLTEAEEHYRSGSDTLERVLSAQRSLVQARREVLTARLDNARARLEVAPVAIEP